MTIYLDAVILLNFLFDAVLLMLTNYLIKGRSNWWKIGLGALFASLIIPIILYFPNSFITTTVGKFLFSIAIVLISFRIVSFFHLIRVVLTFYFVTFTIGGGLIALYYMFEDPITSMMKVYSIQSNYGDPLSWLFVCISFPIVALYFKKQMDRQGAEDFVGDHIYSIQIRVNKKTYHTDAYLDTGNQLVDPVTKQPVVICDASLVRKWFSEEEWGQLKAAHQQKNFSLLPMEPSIPVHLIPYYGVSGQQEWLLAIKPEQILIIKKEKTILVKHVLIGIQFGSLSREARYQCLLHPKIMSGSRFVG